MKESTFNKLALMAAIIALPAFMTLIWYLDRYGWVLPQEW